MEIFDADNIRQSGLWPDARKVELGLPLQKKPNPINDIRVIFLTPFFSKCFERFVLVLLLDYYICLAVWWAEGVLCCRPPQSEFVPASAREIIKCACQNVMSKAPYSQPSIANIIILKPQSCDLAYLKSHICGISS